MLAFRKRSSARSVVNVPSAARTTRPLPSIANEETTRSILDQRSHDRPGQTLVRAKRRRRPVTQPDGSALDRSHPQAAFTILEERPNAIGGQTGGGRHHLDAIAADAADPAGVGGEPDGALFVFEDRIERRRRDPLRGAPPPRTITTTAEEHAVAANPQCAAAIHEKRADR